MQVECGRTPGRVHFVLLGHDVVALTVDAEYDRALRSVSRVSLVYPSESERNRLVETHGATIARSVKADEVLLVRVDGASATLVRVAASDGRVLGRAKIPGSASISLSARDLGRDGRAVSGEHD